MTLLLPWLVEFSLLLLGATPGRRAEVMRAAREAFDRLTEDDLRANLLVLGAGMTDRIDRDLAAWLLQRTEPREVRDRRIVGAALRQHELLGLARAQRITPEETVAGLLEVSRCVCRDDDPELWHQLHHNLAEACILCRSGDRGGNLEAAIQHYRAAVEGRQGRARVLSLLGLAQALKQRQRGDPATNRCQSAALVEEAAHWLSHHRDAELLARVHKERAELAEMSGCYDDADQHWGRALVSGTPGDVRRTLEGIRDEALVQRALRHPEYRARAVSAMRARLSRAEQAGTVEHRARIRHHLWRLGERMPLTPAIVAGADLRWWVDELEEATLDQPLSEAIEERMRAEVRGAFASLSGPTLTACEHALAPLLLAIARRQGSERPQVALGVLSLMGGWRLRRALRWTDLASTPELAPLSWQRVLEDNLEVVSRVSELLAPQGLPTPFPDAPLERVQSYLQGDASASLTVDDLFGLLRLPTEQRSTAIVDVRQGILEGLRGALLDASVPEALRASALVPPMQSPLALQPWLLPGDVLLLIQQSEARVVVGLAVCRAYPEPPTFAIDFECDPERLISALASHPLAALGLQCAAASGRLMLVARGVGARLATDQLDGIEHDVRVVHLVGVDEVVSAPPPPARRTRRVVLVEDGAPEANLPLASAVLETLAARGFEVVTRAELRTGQGLARLPEAEGVIVLGHGDHQGVLGPMVGDTPTRDLQQLPLAGAKWALCLSCASGASGVAEHALWDLDAPEGAAEQLLLAGAAAALDCLRPVLECHAAVLMEEFGVRVSRGEEAESAWFSAVYGWRRAWAGLVETMRRGPVPTELALLDAWLLDWIDATRRARLEGDCAPLPRGRLFRSLGPLAPWTEGVRTPEEDATVEAVRDAFLPREQWTAFRWMARR